MQTNTHVIRVSDDTYKQAKIRSKASQRSISNQIDHWATVGRIAEDNPDLPLTFINGILIGREEIEAGEYEDTKE